MMASSSGLVRSSVDQLRGWIARVEEEAEAAVQRQQLDSLVETREEEEDEARLPLKDEALQPLVFFGSEPVAEIVPRLSIESPPKPRQRPAPRPFPRAVLSISNQKRPRQTFVLPEAKRIDRALLCEKKASSSKRLEAIALFYGRARSRWLRRLLKAWKATAANRVKGRQLIALANDFRKSRDVQHLKFISRIWRNYAHFAQRARDEALRKAKKQRRDRDQKRIYTAWRRRVVHSLRIQHTLAAARKRRCAKCALDVWQILLAQARHKTRKAIASFCARLQFRLLRLWKNKTDQARAQRRAIRLQREVVWLNQALDRATQWKINKTLGKILQAWRLAAESLKQERILDSELQARRLQVEKIMCAHQKLKSEKLPLPPCSQPVQPPSMIQEEEGGGRLRKIKVSPLPKEIQVKIHTESRRLEIAKQTRERIQTRRKLQAQRDPRDEAVLAQIQKEREDRIRKDKETKTARLLQRQQWTVAKMHAVRADLRWRGIEPWRMLLREAKRLESKAHLWYRDGVTQRTWDAWIGFCTNARQRRLQIRAQAIRDATRMIERVRISRALRKWQVSLYRVLEAADKLRRRHNRSLAAAKLLYWRQRCQQEQIKSSALKEHALALGCINTKKHVLRAWRHAIALWREQAALDHRCQNAWAQVRSLIDDDHDDTSKYDYHSSFFTVLEKKAAAGSHHHKHAVVSSSTSRFRNLFAEEEE